MEEEAPDVSVVIVSYNVARLIGACLDSVKRESGEICIEVFVVDNASVDGTPALLRQHYPWITLLEPGANLGFSAGNNLALPRCRGRNVALLNPDTVVHEGALRRLVRHLDEHPEAGAVGPMLLLGDGTIQHECARNLPSIGNLAPWLLLLDKLEWKLRFGGRSVESATHPPVGTPLDRFNLLSWKRDRTCAVQSVSGACMVLRRRLIEEVGLLDEASPMYLDDIDYCHRILDAGWRIYYVSEARVTHLWKQSAQPRRAGDYYALGCHAIWLYLRKHEGRAAASAFAALACIAALLRLPVSLLGAALSRSPDAQRRLAMAWSLFRWAFRVPRAAPRFGFASEAARASEAGRKSVL